MHELGIATGVLDSVVKVANENRALSVKKIDIVIGKKAAIIDEMFTEAFNALKELEEYSVCKNALISTKLVDGKDENIKWLDGLSPIEENIQCILEEYSGK